MKYDPDPEIDALVSRFFYLYEKQDADVKSGDYEAAAEARDERVNCENQLIRLAGKTFARNMRAAADTRRNIDIPLLIDWVARKDLDSEPIIQNTFQEVPTPVRWIMPFPGLPDLSALHMRLKTESLYSDYYRAVFPILSEELLKEKSHPAASLLKAVVGECGRDKSPSWNPFRVVLILPLPWSDRNLLDVLLAELRDDLIEFVVTGDSESIQPISQLPNTTIIV